MSIGFNEVPNGSLTPFFYVEIDNSGAFQGSSVIPWKNLLIGQQLSTKSAPKEVIQITDLAQAENLFGAGSILANQVEAYLASNSSQPLYALPLDDADGGAPAQGSVQFVGTATKAGVISLMVGGKRVQTAVDVGDAPATVASNVASDFALNAKLSVTASASTDTVTLTAKNDGLMGNEIDIRANYYEGEELPEGVSIVITGMSGGLINPDLSAEGVSGLLSNQWFQAISHPYSDTANMAYMESFLSDRWGADLMTSGIQYVGKNDTFSNLTAYGDSRNSPFSVVVNSENVPTTPWEVGAETAGLVGVVCLKRSSQTFPVFGIH